MKLYVLNDNKHSFEYVIDVIQTYLNLPYSQANSIVSIIHYNGKCEVMESDDKTEMLEVYEGMNKAGLLLKVEEWEYE